MFFVQSGGLLHTLEILALLPAILIIYMGYRSGREELPLHALVIAYGVLLTTSAVTAAMGVSISTSALVLFTVVVGMLCGVFATSGAWRDDEIHKTRLFYGVTLGVSTCGISGFGSAMFWEFRSDIYVLSILALSFIGILAREAGHRMTVVDAQEE